MSGEVAPKYALSSTVVKAAKKAAEKSFPIEDWLIAVLSLPDGAEILWRGGAERTHAMQEVEVDFVVRCADLGLIGVDHHIQDRILPGIRACHNNSSSVLITGETGTGKEVVARCIHSLGKRKDKEFRALNCGGIHGEILESELFGHEKGAFTGATRRKIGLIESADAGTLFLDEIGDMPIELQVKLLRFLNDGTYYRLGGTEEKTSDVRLIAATNAITVDSEMQSNLRSDLYFRLNTMEIHLWPLYLRPGDLPLLLQSAIRRANSKCDSLITSLTELAILEALYWRWPGNIRELMSTVERAVNAAEWSSEDANCLFSLELPLFRLPSEALNHLASSKVKVDELHRFDLGALINYCRTVSGGPDWSLAKRMSDVVARRRMFSSEGNDEDRSKTVCDMQSTVAESVPKLPRTPDGLLDADWKMAVQLCKWMTDQWKCEWVQHQLMKCGCSKKELSEKMKVNTGTIRNIIKRAQKNSSIS